MTAMNKNYLIGIDLGTSGLKTVVLTADGQVVGSALREYPLEIPHPGWAEQDPENWYRAALAALAEALQQSGIDPQAVAGIGLAGQMHSTVCLDKEMRPLRPAIIWADQRSEAQVERVYRDIGRPNLAAWTGNPLATGFMLASWLWLAENEPQVCQATRSLLLPKDYLRYRLTGQLGTEPSDAASTLLFDPARRLWSTPLLSALQIPTDMLPPVFPSAGIAGGLLPEAAAASGLIAGTPVIFGGSDQAMQAFAQGVVTPGQVSCTIGTGGQVFAPALTPTADPELRLHLFCHVLPGLWHYEAAMLTAGLALHWLRDNLLGGEDYTFLADAASSVGASSEGLFFLPYLAGERTPVMDSGAQAAFIGLALRHDRRHLTRAVMEGVVFALRQGMELMEGLGVPMERVLASGGATRHPLWLQLEADIFNRPIYPNPVHEATARGAALLAGLGVGLFANPQEVCCSSASWQAAAVLPDPSQVERYTRAYQTYCQIYPALKNITPPGS
jgi:xylulokinase